jgi:hypothetical protein
LTDLVVGDRHPDQEPYVAGPGRVVGQLEGATHCLDPVLDGSEVHGVGRRPEDLDLQVCADHGQ